MVEQTLLNHQLPADIAMQVSEMVREAVDNAIRQLTANGGSTPQQAAGYQHPARSKEELLATQNQADTTTVPRGQPIQNPPADLAPKQDIIVPEKTNDGWVF